MEQTESELENAIGKFFLSRGLFCQKFPKVRTHGHRQHNSPLEMNGPPDLYILTKSRFIGVEVKKPGCHQSESQKSFERHMRKAGSLYFVCRSLEDAEIICRAIQEL